VTRHQRRSSRSCWHDRLARPEYLLPWTREKDPGAAQKLWDCLTASATTGETRTGLNRYLS
jgi:hypothetical protein